MQIKSPVTIVVETSRRAVVCRWPSLVPDKGYSTDARSHYAESQRIDEAARLTDPVRIGFVDEQPAP